MYSLCSFHVSKTGVSSTEKQTDLATTVVGPKGAATHA